MTLAERFWAKVETTGPDECWLWQASRNRKGYGLLRSAVVNGRTQSNVGTHRVTFFLANGYWPTVARHTCDNPPCVNPAHILDGTTKDNIQDMLDRGRCVARNRTHCPQGHVYSDENTYIHAATGHRKCRECMRANDRRQSKRLTGLTGEAGAEYRAKAAARQRAYKARQRALREAT